ncbi:response regulator transcription factor [Aureibaculum sp. 2210JD6-5]|uniref:response regulator transcription factor n=1 Tax=Aureibaculum sp. 2210JD6-5 TaxID=3103957 RepID=UPI002AAD75CF|nr:response regulator transcription factor [Aureibaculum sp. 2210JD6-5]MDY7396409.1 response regulator transcription factor [Aureibaculum sp. 2210JD6-5]
MPKHTIAIIDDHLLFAQSLKSLINTFEDFEVTQHALNGKIFIDDLKKKSKLPDIALMDLNMPIMDGLETTLFLRENYPSIKVLALSMDDEERSILKMIKNGAKGYLLKDIHPNILKEALNSLINEGYYHSKRVSDSLVHSLHPDTEKEIKLLERELEFLKLASTEMTYKEIADVMNLSPKTIDGYREQLFKKLEVKNRIGLVVYALKNGFA